jgi:UDP-2,3-diacylglucosamine pyrophosphatase LpxH
MQDAIHTTANGRKLWVLHGDMFDTVLLYARWLAFLGDYAYSLLVQVMALTTAGQLLLAL